MEETFEEQSSERPDMQRYLEVVRRRYLYFSAGFWSGEPVGSYRCAISQAR